TDPIPVGYFPYAAQLVGRKLFVSNWGVTTRRFADGVGTTDPATGIVTHKGTPHIGGGPANRYADPDTDPVRSSSLTVLNLGGGDAKPISLARPIDGVTTVGGTHPSALAAVTGRGRDALYVADANEDRIAVVDPAGEKVVAKVALPAPGGLRLPSADRPGGDGDADAADGPTFGLTPDAVAVSPDRRTLYVAEAGLNSVAVYDVSRPWRPRFAGRIPTGWYPSGVTVSPDGKSLYVTNSKGAGSPYAYQGTYDPATGTLTNPDVNWLFGSVQKVDLATVDLAAATRRVTENTFVTKPVDRCKLGVLQRGIRHVVFVLRENKTYDTYFGDDPVLGARGGNGGGTAYAQYGRYVPNTRALAHQLTVGDNNYADAEESDAGHSFALAGTSTDYQQKTLLSRFARPLANIKNEDPEDYPLRGYLFNALARNGRSFRDYGDGIRVSGYDDGSSADFCADDPKPGCDNATYDNIQDTTSHTVGLAASTARRCPPCRCSRATWTRTTRAGACGSATSGGRGS
ncbi:MAG TPA: beta-propeller fold lactonase family protein, partial [Frankiaceae bacterium]|nr:beta-propeller fold lactonase family protein [Frankiaceae bacterium]